ncbi:MAG: response regulator [Acetobacteraceae bacterium]|nr:response regulator [Acetobacteraceae bacterium]
MAELDMVLAEQTGRAMETSDFVLRSVIDLYLHSEQDSENMSDFAQSRLEGMRQIHAIDLISPTGSIIASSRPITDLRLPPAALALLARHTSDPRAGLLFSEPIHEGNGVWASLMARRMQDDDGRFRGIAVAWITLNYFENFYQALQLQDQAAILLHRRDGTVLARYPHDDAALGVSYANMPPFREVLAHADSGTLEMDSPLDSGRRILAIRALKAFPLAVNISVDEDAVLATWRRQAWIFGTVMVGSSAIALLLLLKLAQRTDEVERLLARSLAAQAQAEASNHDLTREMEERERAETAMRFLQRLEAVGQLTGGVAHDFNNLLTVLLGNIDLMQAHPAATIFTGRLTTMRAAAERGARLVSQLLAFARRQPLKAKAVDLAQLVRGMRPLLESAVGSQVVIETLLYPDVPMALVDQTQIELVILNLAINARDAMPVGGTLRLEVARTEIGTAILPDAPPPGTYVRLRVTDTGTGMQPDVAARAFDPYFTTKPPGAGSGLGLSQVYGVAHQSGGTAHIETAPGQGTTVEVLLPEAGLEEGSIEPLHEVTPSNMTGHGDASLLIVDDDADVRVTTALLLRRMGYRVTEADNAEEALMALELDRGIELLLTDVIMPGVSGPELARKAVQKRPELPVVFFSGYADPESIVGSIPLSRLLRKPFRPTDLVALIETALAEARVAAMTSSGHTAK